MRRLWLAIAPGLLGLLSVTTAAADIEERLAQANVQRGQLLYLQCRACHDVEAGAPHKGGPNLHGVFGRQAGTVAGFRFTEAMRRSGVAWTPATLDRFLAQPGAMVPGNGMAFPGMAREADRASLIAWLLANSTGS